MKKNFIDSVNYSLDEMMSAKQMDFFDNGGGRVYNEPIFSPIYEYQPVYNPNPKMFDEPIFSPSDEYLPPVYIPKFPDYSMMDCSQLQIEMNDLNQIMMTGKFVYELRVAYEQAYSAAQDAYIQKCRLSPPPVKSTPLPPEGCTYDADFNLICIEPEPMPNPITPTFVDDTQSPIKTEVPDAQSNPTFIDDTKAAVPTLPTTVSKNLKPYIYVGLGIVAILVVARILTKK